MRSFLLLAPCFDTDVTHSSITGLVKLEDANNAGTKLGSKCTLILTEGDSAKALAVSGLAVVGRDNFGVFPLRGKLLNVREATGKALLDNVEIQAIKQILGLQQGKVYTNVDSLRYGSLMIMADQVRAGCLMALEWRLMRDAGSRWITYQGTRHQFPRLLVPLAPQASQLPARVHHAHCQGVFSSATTVASS